MKKQGPSQQTASRYLACFIDLKKAIEENPKLQISDFAKHYKIGKHPISALKKTRVIIHNGYGYKWVGPDPTYNLVVEITQFIANYHADLKARKKQQGDLFERKKRGPITRGKFKPEFKTEKINVSDINEWRDNYKKQVAEKSDVLIQQPGPDRSLVSEYINHDETPTTAPTTAPDQTQKQPRIFEFKIFGLKLFTIKY